MKKIKIYVYGAGHECNRFLSYLMAYKKEIEVLGIVTTTKLDIMYLDGVSCITVDEMKINEIDYIVIAVKNWKEILGILNAKGITSDKIILSKVFSLPYFDLEQYLALRQEKITILSNTCLGAYIYEELGLEYTSPTIYAGCWGSSYLKFIKEYEKMLELDMEIYDKETFYKGNPYTMEHMMPKGIINNDIIWDFLHNTDVNEAVQKWNVRKKRCNLKNVAILMVIHTDEEAKCFEELPYAKKIGIYYKNLKLESVLYCAEWNHIDVQKNYVYNWIHFANDYMCSTHGNIGKINWIKFLNGCSDYVRF